MKVIVGLGNPGRKYRDTPHNIGFEVADRLASRRGVAFETRRKVKAEVAETEISGERVILVKPMTYMNLSGDAVRMITANLPLEADDLMIVLDEVNLDLGRLRIRENGSHGGHNGLRSIVERLGTQDVPRLRIGVRPDREVDNLTDFVLGSLRPEERKQLEMMTEAAADAVEAWITEGTRGAANRFNAPPTNEQGKPEEK